MITSFNVSTGAARESIGITAIVAWFVLLALILCVVSLGHPYSHDEEFYVAAARMAAEQRLYADFFYGQTPFYPLILGPLLAAVPSDQVLVAARLFSALCGSLVLILLYNTLRGLSLDRFLSLILITVVALSSTMLPSFSVARNDSLPALFGTAAIWLVVRSLRSPGSGALLVAGFLSGCAVLTKVTWSFVPLSVGAFLALRWICSGRESFTRLAAYVIGGIVSILLALPSILAAPEAMFFENVVYPHLAFRDWYVRIGQASHLDWDRTAYRYVRFLAQPMIALIAVMGVVLWPPRIRELIGEAMRGVQEFSSFLLFALCTLTAAAFALAPRAMNVYYFSPTILMAVLLVGALLSRTSPDFTSRRRAVLSFAALIVSSPGLWHIAGSAIDLRNGAGGVARVAADAEVLKGHLCSLGRQALVATLSPLRVMAAGYRIYPEFVPGPFVFRGAHLFSAARLDELRVAGPQTMDKLFRERRPDAVYVGHERPWKADSGIELDEALERWARANGYREMVFAGSKTKKTFLAPEIAQEQKCAHHQPSAS